MSQKRVNITLPEELLEKSKAYAKEKENTLSGLIKDCLENRIQKHHLNLDNSTYDELAAVANKLEVRIEDLIKEALEDAASENNIKISVSYETKKTYMKMFSFEGVSDKGFEPYLKVAIANYIEENFLKSLKEK